MGFVVIQKQNSQSPDRFNHCVTLILLTADADETLCGLWLL